MGCRPAHRRSPRAAVAARAQRGSECGTQAVAGRLGGRSSTCRRAARGSAPTALAWREPALPAEPIRLRRPPPEWHRAGDLSTVSAGACGRARPWRSSGGSLVRPGNRPLNRSSDSAGRAAAGRLDTGSCRNVPKATLPALRPGAPGMAGSVGGSAFHRRGPALTPCASIGPAAARGDDRGGTERTMAAAGASAGTRLRTRAGGTRPRRAPPLPLLPNLGGGKAPAKTTATAATGSAAADWPGRASPRRPASTPAGK